MMSFLFPSNKLVYVFEVDKSLDVFTKNMKKGWEFENEKEMGGERGRREGVTIDQI